MQAKRFALRLLLVATFISTATLQCDPSKKQTSSELKRLYSVAFNAIKQNKGRIVAFAIPAFIGYSLLRETPTQARGDAISWLENFQKRGLPLKVATLYYPLLLNIVGLSLPSLVERRYVISTLSDAELEVYIVGEAIIKGAIAGLISVVALETAKSIYTKHFKKPKKPNKAVEEQPILEPRADAPKMVDPSEPSQ